MNQEWEVLTDTKYCGVIKNKVKKKCRSESRRMQTIKKKTLNFFDVIENAELLYNVEERTNWGYSVKQLVVCKMNSK